MAAPPTRIRDKERLTLEAGLSAVRKPYALPSNPLERAKVVLAGATGDDIATGLQFNPRVHQYNTYVEEIGKGFMSTGKSKGPLNFLENIWRKGVAESKAARLRGRPNFKWTGKKKDTARLQEVGDTTGVAADTYREGLGRSDRPVLDVTGEKVSPANYHPTKGWFGYDRSPGSSRLPKNRK